MRRIRARPGVRLPGLAAKGPTAGCGTRTDPPRAASSALSARGAKNLSACRAEISNLEAGGRRDSERGCDYQASESLSRHDPGLRRGRKRSARTRAHRRCAHFDTGVHRTWSSLSTQRESPMVKRATRCPDSSLTRIALSPPCATPDSNSAAIRRRLRTWLVVIAGAPTPDSIQRGQFRDMRRGALGRYWRLFGHSCYVGNAT